ncbi:MAG: protein kinase [Phycisphaerales bacterium]|nr:MAG: protein kinase [Phycisphaerales bacterium]
MDAEQIFHEAADISDPKERAAYLDAACKDDDNLRAAVEALLHADEAAGGFLESPAVEAKATFDTSTRIDGPGTKIGRYEVLELIGEGGMGLVYLAEQKEPVKRRVALKIIKPGMDSRQVIARFEAERQALALLDHPNIAHVFDAGTTETGRPYFVMEHVKGMSVTRYCDERKLNIEQRLRLFEQVCEAVHHAHQKGIIHRDLKPSNILVSVHGDRAVPKIIDFGIAKAITQPLTDKTFVTFQGQLLGTPEYMSPEQVDLATQDIDTRSDIYSLGVVLYELLAGVLPFEKESFEGVGFAEIQQTIREQEPASPSIRLTRLGEKARVIAASRGTQVVPLARRLHRELEWIPLRAMRKDRCRRYRSATEMADDIRNYLTGLPLIAGPETAIYRVKKFVHKHAGSVATVALVAAAIVVGLVISIAMYFLAEDARQKEAVAREKESVARIRAENAEEATKEKAEELRRTLYVNSIQLAEAKHREGNASQVRSLLDSCPEDLRSWEWDRLNYIRDESISSLHTHKDRLRHAILSPEGNRIITSGDKDNTIKVWDLATGEEHKRFRGHENVINVLAVSPDGRHIASGSDDKTIKLWDATSGAEVMTLRGHQAPVYALAFSPDGKHIASGGYYDDSTIILWDAQTGAQLRTLRGHGGEINALAFSPDGKRIVSGSGDDTIKLWDAQTGAEVTTLMGHDTWVHSVAFSPDGKRIVSGSWDKTVKVWDSETGTLISTIRGHVGPVFSVVFGLDGNTIASVGGDNTVRVWDANSGEELKTFHGHDWNVAHVAFSPDGKHLISASMDGTVKLWDMMIDRVSFKFRGHIHHVVSIAFSPDGRQIVSGSVDSTIKLWDAQTSQPIRTMRDHGLAIWSVAFSPDGKRIVSGNHLGVVRVWDTSTGAPLLALRGHKVEVRCVAFSPDGKHIVSGSGDRTVKLWSTSSGSEIMTFRGHKGEVRCVAFSPDGKHIISGSYDKTIRIWDASSGSEVMTFQNHTDYILSVCFSPDGKRIASASRDRTVKVWDAETGGELMNLTHPDCVYAAFSPDGTRIVTGCYDGRVRLWDSATGAELLTLAAESFIFDTAFSPNGKTIVAGIGDGEVMLWESTMPPGSYEPRKTAESARNLVQKLYSKNRLYHDVISELQSDVAIDSDVRRLAIQMANSRKWEDADKLIKKAWQVISSPDKGAEEYRVAFERAEKANALEPNEPTILNTLGAAHYRVGSHEDALKTLVKSARMLSDAKELPDPLNLAFTAMALHKIGRASEAMAAIERLRELRKDDATNLIATFRIDTGDLEYSDVIMEIQGLLAEAEKVVAGEGR